MDIKYVIATKYDALQTERDELAARVEHLLTVMEYKCIAHGELEDGVSCMMCKARAETPSYSLQANNALVNNAAVDGCATWLRDNGWFSDDGNALAAMCESVKIQGE